MQDLLMKATLDSVLKVALGIELDGLSGTYEEGTQFTDAFDTANAITSFRFIDAFWKIKRFLNIASEAKLRKNIKVVDDFVYKLIKSKIERLNNRHDDLPSVSGKKEDILSRFLELKETDPKYLRDIHPDIQEKIAKEIIEATQVRSNSSIEELAAKVNEETLDKMHYLHAAFSETLRLYPAVPVGDQITYVPYAMGRTKTLWGNDAEEFRPERWLNEIGHFQPKSPFIFTAFQAGPRICLGKDFAYRQMKIFSMILLGSYKFKLINDDSKPVRYKTALTLHIEGGLHLRVLPRSSYEATVNA
ncbi:hypothetical protein Patl1_19994 [Pistacia atlantica]|uniref:Uncharacterized protein n=1 Tax=Pistacia atlantica TaxID=434234 RepID=A0ACC1BIQ7_9ROSI|nr:hypothetical protein Patl1_19994 [Pistacia atlantica]